MRAAIINIILLLSVLLSKETAAQTVITLTEPFSASGGVSVDTTGVIYVADFGDALNNANGAIVYKVTVDGEVSAWATGLFGASGNEFDSQGNLFQSNIAANRISKITPDGTVSIFTTTNILGPVGVTVDSNDNVYTTNCRTPGAIIKTTPAGVSTIFADSSLLSCPNGLTIDNDGNLYTVNFSNGNLLKITPNGEVSLLAAIPGGNNGHVIFGNGRLYAVGRGANRIYEVSLTGEVKILAGTGSAGNSDGDPLQTTWFIPNGIGISPSGNELYINDKVPNTGTQLNPVVVRMIAGIGEIPPGYLAAGFMADVRFGFSSLTVQFTDISYSDSISPVSSWSWDFDNDGNEDSDEENPTWTYSDSGTYSVSLTVTNDSTSRTRSRTDFINLIGPVALIDMNSNSVDLGLLDVNDEPLDTIFYIYNREAAAGQVLITIDSSNAESDGGFAVDSSSFILQGGDSAKIGVRIRPQRFVPGQGYFSKIIVDSPDGFGSPHFEKEYRFGIVGSVGVDSDRENIPDSYELSQNYPNPFNPVTTIGYSLPLSGDVSLIIYNLRGEEVALLVNDIMPAGNHQVSWDASDMASGIYLYRLEVLERKSESPTFVQTRKMILLR